MPLLNIFKLKNAKIAPSSTAQKNEDQRVVGFDPPLPMKLLKLQTVLKLYGGQRHPRLKSYDYFSYSKYQKEFVEWKYVPKGSTTIYISHEPAGRSHPDPEGTQMYHLLLMLERLQKGKISRTDMDSFHTLAYNHNFTTTAKEWSALLAPEKTYIWYDGFCMPSSRLEDGFRSIPEYIKRCDFMIILVPGCIHSDRIDPRTKRKMNLCYRTYRLRACCVLELFSAFLTTKGGEKARPALLVRSGTGIPNWVSPLECQKLAVGTSSFQCCESNHTTILQCRRSVCLTILDRMIKERTESLFMSKDYAEARCSLCIRNYWCRGLIDTVSKKIWNSLSDFKSDLRWVESEDDDWTDREGLPLLAYAATCNCIHIVREVLSEIKKITDVKVRNLIMQISVPKRGIIGMGLTGGCTVLNIAMVPFFFLLSSL